MSDQPRDLDERIRRLLGDVEPGDDDLRADARMHRLMAVLDDIDPGERLESPPPGLWAGIAAGAGLDTPAEVGAPEAPGGSGTVTPLRRSASRPWWLGAAAAVLVVIVVAVGALAVRTGERDPEQQLATADLELLLDESAATGSARLVQIADDAPPVLQLDLDGLDEIDGYYEVWLLTPEVDGLVSLGPLRSDGRHELPPGLDVTQFSVVDISVEPHDGDPAHSGNSVLRGGLVEL